MTHVPILSREELYDVDADPLEFKDLINDPEYYQVRQELRRALYQQLKTRAGAHAVPFQARLAEGVNLRHDSRPRAAPFLDAWKVKPNRPDRLNGLLPDTAEKKRYLDAGKPYLPWLIDRTPKDAGKQ